MAVNQALRICVTILALSFYGQAVAQEQEVFGIWTSFQPEATDPASVGIRPAAMDALTADLRALVDEGKRAGVVSAVMRRGQFVHIQAYGWQDIENAVPMRLQSLFRMCSMTRPITSVAAMILFEEGRFGLDDPIADYLPEFAAMNVIDGVVNGEVSTSAAVDPITVKDLLMHTAGLGYERDYPAEVGLQRSEVFGAGDLATGIKNLAGHPLLQQPGSRWFYGFSTDVLGRLVEVVSGEPFEDFVQARILDPLQMTGSSFHLRPGDEELFADVYRHDGGQLVNATPGMANLCFQPDAAKPASPGGGLAASVLDYVRFGQMLLNRGEVTPVDLEAMLENTAGRSEAGAETGDVDVPRRRVRILKPFTVALMTKNHLTSEQGPLWWSKEGRSIANSGWAAFDGYGFGLGFGVRLKEGPHLMPGSPGEFGWGGLADTIFFVDPEQEIVAVAATQYMAADENELSPLPRILRKHIYGGLTD